MKPATKSVKAGKTAKGMKKRPASAGSDDDDDDDATGTQGDDRTGEPRDKLKSTWFRAHRDTMDPTVLQVFDANEKTTGGRIKNTDLVNSLVRRIGAGKYKVDSNNPYVQDNAYI